MTLSGEAYFDVVRNPEKPFIIHTSKIDIKVIGTEFNVKSYPGDKTTEATLIRGIIEVIVRNRPSETIILKPNKKIVVLNEIDSIKENTTVKGKKINKNPAVAIRDITYIPEHRAVLETSWIENKLIFRGETFKDLAIRMERWYGVRITFDDKVLEQKRFHGIFEKESIRNALDALKITEPFNYTIQDNDVVISK